MEEKQFVDKLYASHQNAQRIPSPSAVCSWLEGLLTALFPELANRRYNSRRELDQHYRQLKLELFSILETMEEMLPVSAEELEQSFLDKLPTLHQLLHADAEALLRGDPAAVSKTEVIRTYPGFKAIAMYRLAHEFHRLGVPLIPRILTEHVHGLTGIDIHPGARIGESFCMDHGTGIVIGETVEIGNDVKLYQGVTLGALSLPRGGSAAPNRQRHPTLEDEVTVYAGASILGGDTVIGKGSVIGGNVWLTRSVPPGSKIFGRARDE